jgi:hypothetical protein
MTKAVRVACFSSSSLHRLLNPNAIDRPTAQGDPKTKAIVIEIPEPTTTYGRSSMVVKSL